MSSVPPHSINVISLIFLVRLQIYNSHYSCYNRKASAQASTKIHCLIKYDWPSLFDMNDNNICGPSFLYRHTQLSYYKCLVSLFMTESFLLSDQSIHGCACAYICFTITQTNRKDFTIWLISVYPDLRSMPSIIVKMSYSSSEDWQSSSYPVLRYELSSFIVSHYLQDI